LKIDQEKIIKIGKRKFIKVVKKWLKVQKVHQIYYQKKLKK
jgi:hypothetical protein